MLFFRDDHPGYVILNAHGTIKALPLKPLTLLKLPILLKLFCENIMPTLVSEGWTVQDAR